MPTHKKSTSGINMVGKNAPPPAASSTRKMPVISKAPRESPKQKSSHQFRSSLSPNPEKGRRSRKRPASHILATTVTNETAEFATRKIGGPAKISVPPPLGGAQPSRASAPDANHPTAKPTPRTSASCRSRRQKARGLLSRWL